MHPLRQKDALVKKELQVLQQLIGPDEDILLLLHRARKKVKRAVVMKWPQHLPSLEKPARSVNGKTVRFDIYSPF